MFSARLAVALSDNVLTEQSAVRAAVAGLTDHERWTLGRVL